MKILMSNQLVLLHTLIMILVLLLFLFTISVSIFLTMILFKAYSLGEYAANSIWIAPIPSSVFTILFLQKIIWRIYTRLYTSADRFTINSETHKPTKSSST